MNRIVLFTTAVVLMNSFPTKNSTAQDSHQSWQAKPALVERMSAKRNQFNYVEANVPKFDLPDPLTTFGGKLVENANQWENRRKELLTSFRENVYGHRPETPYKMEFQQIDEVQGVFDGKAIGRTVHAVVSIGDRQFTFPFVVFIPTQAQSQPVPATVLINNRYFVPLQKAIEEPDPFWPVRDIVDRGIATAAFHTSDVDPDDKNGYQKGIRAFFSDGVAPQDSDWRSLSAWGWAASRVLDYLHSLPEVDAERAAVIGHSRGGKTALWAACEDPRFAIAYSNNSGCGGAALSRRAYGETVGRITEVFPHWFCKNFSKFAGREQELPIDQHEVMALIAPRAIYVTSADEDLWADPKGEYASLVNAAPVFELLGRESIHDTSMPALDQPRTRGQTGYHIRSGGHNLGQQDWEWFLDFAEKVLRP